MSRRRTPSELLPLAVVGALAAFTTLAGGCGGGGESGGILESIFGTSTSAPSGTQASNSNEPMTLFEKRRLVARLQQDPHALQRMSPRERREVAAMVAAAEHGQDEDERD